MCQRHWIYKCIENTSRGADIQVGIIEKALLVINGTAQALVTHNSAQMMPVIDIKMQTVA